MARVTGLEPAASGVTGRRSNQLSYTRKRRGLEATIRRSELREPPRRVKSVSPAMLVGGERVELPTSSV